MALLESAMRIFCQAVTSSSHTHTQISTTCKKCTNKFQMHIRKYSYRHTQMWDMHLQMVLLQESSHTRNKLSAFVSFFSSTVAARAWLKSAWTCASTDSILVVNGQGQWDLTSIWFSGIRRLSGVWGARGARGNSSYQGCVGVWMWWPRVKFRSGGAEKYSRQSLRIQKSDRLVAVTTGKPVSTFYSGGSVTPSFYEFL